MSGFRRGLMANAKPNWRNFALDGGSIPMLGDDVAVIATGDWEMYTEFEILDESKSGSVFDVATNDTTGVSGIPYLYINMYAPSQTAWSFNMYIPTKKISDISQSPKEWSSGSVAFLLTSRSIIPATGKHTVRIAMVGDTLTFEMDGYTRTATAERAEKYRSQKTTYTPTINGHIYRLYFKDLTNNRMLLDVPRSYLTK